MEKTKDAVTERRYLKRCHVRRLKKFPNLHQLYLQASNLSHQWWCPNQVHGWRAYTGKLQNPPTIGSVDVVWSGVDDDVNEFLLVDNLANVFGCEFGDGGVDVKGGESNAVFFELSLQIGSIWKERKRIFES